MPDQRRVFAGDENRAKTLRPSSAHPSQAKAKIVDQTRDRAKKSKEIVEFRQNGIRNGYTREAIEYILDPKEVWARSYAQWIGDRAARKGHVDNPIRKSMREPAASKLQWSDESFAPIGQAIDDIFRELGWLKE